MCGDAAPSWEDPLRALIIWLLLSLLVLAPCAAADPFVCSPVPGTEGGIVCAGLAGSPENGLAGEEAATCQFEHDGCVGEAVLVVNGDWPDGHSTYVEAAASEGSGAQGVLVAAGEAPQGPFVCEYTQPTGDSCTIL